MATKAKKPAPKKRAVKPAPVASAPVLVMRSTRADLIAYNGFQHPDTIGAVVESKTWDPRPVCGGGIHGLLWGEGNAKNCCWNSDAKWQVYAVAAGDPLVEEVTEQGGGKCKFHRGTLVYLGDLKGAAEYVAANGGAGRTIVGGTATAGECGTATAGYRGTATAGYRGTATAGDGGTATAGECGTATAGDRGTATAGDRGTATAGDRGTATAGDGGTATAGYGGTATAGVGGTATAGYRGTATAGDGGTATAGYRGTATAGDGGTATAGVGGTATAGYGGAIAITWWDGRRFRVAMGYVDAEDPNGLTPGTKYRCDEAGKLVEVTP